MKRLVQRLIYWIQNIVKKRTDAVVLIGLGLVFVSVFSYPNIAVAKPLTPEATTKYQVPDADSKIDIDDKKPVENLKESFKETKDTIVEKLNLNEPLPESTKDFLRSTEDKIEDTFEPITGK
ncbi:MAG: hypothetical protein KI793_04835 [Rivularia sp. (in: Bacteria)]|nr:hypothetical protein [Rivularia sp. MS3]